MYDGLDHHHEAHLLDSDHRLYILSSVGRSITGDLNDFDVISCLFVEMNGSDLLLMKPNRGFIVKIKCRTTLKLSILNIE